MKNYTVAINTAGRFQQKDLQKIGSTPAKNKAEAIEKVYAAFWGKDNDAYIDERMSGLVGPSTKSKMVAIID